MSATIFPTGVTIYNPEKCWSGYTIFQAAERGALLIDMNGNEVRMWEGLQGFPNKMLPGGYVMGSLGERNPKYGLQDQTDLVQVDWDGNIVWKFDKAEYIEDPGEEPQWMARQHHDYQREGNTVGYYVPGSDPKTNSGNTLILAHKNVHVPAISDKMLLDDVIYEVDWDGDIVWEWKVSDHFEELGFDAIARNLMYRDPNYYTGFGNSHIAGDWVHTNSMSVLGPNKWYDAGDKRFHPDNIIIDCRDANIILIIEKATGNIVWKIGPYFDQTPELRKLGWIIGQHHAHMIPRGLPGEGNILIYDNGGWAGYYAPNPGSPTGIRGALRDYSRVLEIDPVTLEIVWQMTPKEAGYLMVFFLSGIQSISTDVNEAARIDGANSWTIFRKITLPLLAPTFLFVSTIALTNSFKLVDHVVIMTEGAPNNASTLLLYYIYQQGFTNFNYGVSSALTTVMLLLLMVVALPRFLSQDKKIQYN